MPHKDPEERRKYTNKYQSTDKHKKYKHEYYLKNIDKHKKYQQQDYFKNHERYLIKGIEKYAKLKNTVEGRKKLKERRSRRSPENPIKRRARSIIRNAIYNGKIKRKFCHCGKKGEAHHRDYSKPLEVIWLCRKHHMELHRKNYEETGNVG